MYLLEVSQWDKSGPHEKKFFSSGLGWIQASWRSGGRLGWRIEGSIGGRRKESL